MITKIACVLLLGASLSHAAIILLPGNNPSGTENNVLLTKDVAGTTITGHFNQSAAVANFRSTQVIISPASGQERIETADGAQLTNLVISLADGYTFGDLIFALNPPNDTTTNPFVMIEADGTVSGLVELTPLTEITLGNEFFTIRASGETLTSVSIQTVGDIGLGYVDQVRFSDITAPGGGPGGGAEIPEPSSLALLGGGLLWLAVRRKRA